MAKPKWSTNLDKQDALDQREAELVKHEGECCPLNWTKQGVTLGKQDYKLLRAIAAKTGESWDSMMQRALKELIEDATGLTRTEPELHPNEWYQTIKQIPLRTKAIHGSYASISQIGQKTRKYIPLPPVGGELPEDPYWSPPAINLISLNFMCRVYLLRNAEQLAKYFQLTMRDLLLQAVDRLILKHQKAEFEKAGSSINAARQEAVRLRFEDARRQNINYYKEGA